MADEKIFDIKKRTFRFSVRIIKLVVNLPKNSVGYAIGNQVIRSGTSIGANIEEAQSAGSRKEFVRGMTIALKEARETDYWLRLIVESETVSLDKMIDIIKENQEIIKILTSIVKKTKLNNKEN